MRKRNNVHNVMQRLPSQKLENYSLQQLMKYIIMAAQLFGLLPLYGTSKKVKNVIFKRLSIKTMFAVFTIISQIIYTYVVSTCSTVAIENFFSFVVIVWNVRALLGVVVFLKIAYKWPKLLQQWTETENCMLDYGPVPSLRRRFQVMSFLFLASGIFEHSMFVYGGTNKVLSIMKEDDSFLKVYFETLYGEFFDTVEYNHYKALFVEFLALMSTFSWSFYDLFIILLSSALAERFRQINKEIYTKQVLSELRWMKIRHQYSKLSFLCITLNDTIAELVLLSFFGNIYFLSVFIFQSFTPRSSFQTFYFWYDVVFTCSHFMLVCFYAAWVHEESETSKYEIYSMSAKNMNYQVERFLYQVLSDEIAIDGAGLFKITRSTILDVATAIITLQLLFFQFNANISSNVE